MEPTPFANQRILVTGASGGIGAGIARAFGEQGAHVAVHYHTREAGAHATRDHILAAGGNATCLHADLRDPDALDRCFHQALHALGGLDILINNAGVVLKASILDTTAAHWDDTLAINLRAPYLLSRLAAAHWLDHPDAPAPGVILHNTSIHGSMSAENFSAYATSKAALETLTRVQALEWAPTIRVNALAPGVVPVERQAHILEQTKDRWLPYIPAGRYGTVREMAALALFLCGPDAAWITGQTFVADGGTLARMNLPIRPQPPAPPQPDEAVQGAAGI